MQAEGEAGELGGEHEAGVNTAEGLDGVCGVVGAEHRVRTERLDERQPLCPDVDTDDLVAERAGDLDRVVAESPGRTDHRHVPAGEDVVLEQLLDGAVCRQAAAGKRGLFVADAVGQLDQRLRIDAELLRERAHDALGLGAVSGLTAHAVLAGAAPVAATGAPEAQDDSVADRDVAVGAWAELCAGRSGRHPPISSGSAPRRTSVWGRAGRRSGPLLERVVLLSRDVPPVRWCLLTHTSTSRA